MKRIGLVIGISSLAALAACGAHGAVGQKLRAKAANDFKCDPEKIETERVPNTVYYEHASGCGRQDWYIYEGTAWVAPTDRAVFEMDCPKEQLTTMPIDRTTVGVSGCGKKAVYVLVLGVNGSMYGAKWVLNSAERQAAQ